MRLGTYWLVRVGVVMLLTGLVFFGNYAYQNFVGELGPGGKVSLLYFASAILLGAGTWWQRKVVTEALKNYAQVLFAGGLAAVYFTTYAAYHFVNLRVIGSPVIDGALLLAWAGFMVWVADRKKSQVLALFAVGWPITHRLSRGRLVYAVFQSHPDVGGGLFPGAQSLGRADICQPRCHLCRLCVLAVL